MKDNFVIFDSQTTSDMHKHQQKVTKNVDVTLTK